MTGIGKAVVSAFVQEGAEVIAADIAYGELGSTSGWSPLELHLDVTNPGDWDTLLERVGRLDALVACAGDSEARTIAETSINDWRRVLAVNLDGAFLSLKYGGRAVQRVGAS